VPRRGDGAATAPPDAGVAPRMSFLSRMSFLCIDAQIG